ncbi:MAG: 8-amino-7-oxononanoate synthase [Chromatiales bacterium]|nr:8-amino-7-oxononanoate synthase [Gammaproteobacteria bacterium]MCP5351792.1 8-amino-7-oxononanoate synthase [Chromatiales bacterium]
MSFGDRIQRELAERRANDLLRARRTVVANDGVQLTLADGRQVVGFASNDYLGLANHPDVAAAFRLGIATWGSGSGAAHLVSGHSAAHHALEEEVADWLGRERALLFSTGYMANLGTIAALIGRGDRLFQDRLNHASLLDAGLLSGARHQRYAHADAGDLERRLGDGEGETLIATDGVFSMDGDIAPLPDLARAAQAHGAWLMVDDAHGVGVLGEQGRGSCDHHGLNTQAAPVLMGTLGKAFGTAGAFVAGDADLIDYLIQRARPYIYTTALPAALAEATRASLSHVRDGALRTRLHANIARFRRLCAQALPTGVLMDSPTAIQPLLVGDNARALALGEALLDAGFLVTAIRPPTVPAGTARLRVTLSAAHTEPQIDQLIAALERVWS